MPERHVTPTDPTPWFESEPEPDPDPDDVTHILPPDWSSDDFFLARRSPIEFSNSIEFSRARMFDSESFRIPGFDSDSDSDPQIIAINPDPETETDTAFGIPLCWDCLHLDENPENRTDSFDWEEVEDRNIVNIDLAGDQDHHDDDDLVYNDVDRTIEWEVLMAVNNLGRTALDPVDVDSYFEQEGFVYDNSDFEAYEVLFGQLTEQEGNLKGSPPAAKNFVENLPVVVLTEEDAKSKENGCAVCKDGILMEERVRKLPCCHYYHEECILPWLKIRNTCPLCRFEMPTDDAEYEKWKARRGGGGFVEDEDGLRYDFEVLPDA